jgi:hypothetical protein
MHEPQLRILCLFSFYWEVEHTFSDFPKYQVLLGFFSAGGGREGMYIPTARNKNSHETAGDNEVRIINFATSKRLVLA